MRLGQYCPGTGCRQRTAVEPRHSSEERCTVKMDNIADTINHEK